MAGLLNIGLTGLNAAQLQLNTTSHNITNAGTPGYSRQTVIQTTNDPLFSGAGFFGQGTRIAAVTRQYSQFLENQVLAADNRRSEYASYSTQISQINNLLADSGAGLSPALQAFFAGVQEVAANPSSIPARQAMISSAQALVARFQAMDERLSEVRQGTEGEIASSVELINTYAAAIGEMNQRIVIAQAAGPSVPANDLLDQRNVLVAELNKLIKTTTIVESDGQMNVFIGSGQPLVLGQNVSRLGVAQDAHEPTRSAVALITSNGSALVLPEKLLTGGSLGGLLAFRRESLDPAQNRLGLVALGLATEFNRVHALGVDLEGMLGREFFTVPPVAVSPSNAAQVAVDPASVARLTDSDYILSYDGTSYTLTNRNTGRTSSPFTDGATFEGLMVDVSASGLTAGQTALIQPTRYAARDIGVAINEARRVAAGSPVSVGAPVSNAGSGKLGDIVVESVEGMSGGPGAHFGEFRVQYSDTPTPGFVLQTLDAVSGTWSPASGLAIARYDADTGDFTAAPAYDPATRDSTGTRFRVTHPDGWSFEFSASGSPKSGDVFTFSPTEAGVADNRNAARLGALQTGKSMLDAGAGTATATFQSAYSQLVTQIGNKTREVQVGEETQKALLQQATDARDGLSGVNLDEEAANLIRYQQAYQAAGRVMSIAQRLFDEVLSIAR